MSGRLCFFAKATAEQNGRGREKDMAAHGAMQMAWDLLIHHAAQKLKRSATRWRKCYTSHLQRAIFDSNLDTWRARAR